MRSTCDVFRTATVLQTMCFAHVTTIMFALSSKEIGKFVQDAISEYDGFVFTFNLQ